jgi:hypothetical protein
VATETVRRCSGKCGFHEYHRYTYEEVFREVAGSSKVQAASWWGRLEEGWSKTAIESMDGGVYVCLRSPLGAHGSTMRVVKREEGLVAESLYK